MKNCKFNFVFPDSLTSFILGLQATKPLIRSMLYSALFKFLCNHFGLVSELEISLSLYINNIWD